MNSIRQAPLQFFQSSLFLLIFSAFLLGCGGQLDTKEVKQTADRDQCQAINELVSVPFQTVATRIAAPQLSPNKGTFDAVQAKLVEKTAREFQQELTRIQALRKKLNDLNLSQSELQVFRDSYVSQLQELEGLLSAASQELRELDRAAKVLSQPGDGANQPPPETRQKARQLLTEARGEEYPSNRQKIDQKTPNLKSVKQQLAEICGEDVIDL